MRRFWGKMAIGGSLFLLSAEIARVGLAPAAAGPAPSPTAPTQPSLDLPFPRLGMWWPNVEEQPLKDIARYDFIILSPDEEEAIPKLKALHADILLLTSTNACELPYYPSEDLNEWEEAQNEVVRAVPAAWFLTQTGSKLRESIDTKTTRIPVEEVSLEKDGKEIDLFIARDTVLLEGESLLVEKVDKSARMLTVKRGYVRPAAAHRAGVRIAAHIAFWPGSWLLNLSTLSPKADVGFGMETWAEYNARFAARLLENPLWDGILLDRSDPDESWLIDNSTARSIDPDQSNRPLEDTAAFDKTWNAGLRSYENRLRAAVGEKKIIYANWGMPNYDLLNGNNFEGFPDNRHGVGDTPWQVMTFGPERNGSYYEWLAKARTPNLSMIETYEEDGGPEATGGGAYDNPASTPDFKPNYRKMRFGLATALLNDGFFSYEINTNGHGSLGLLWFDEYDNAGQGRGYLGKPKGSAQRVTINMARENLFSSGAMDSPGDLKLWNFWADEEAGYAARISLDKENPAVGKGAARIDMEQTKGSDWQVSLSFAPIKIAAGEDYTLSLRARAASEGEISAWVQQPDDPWETHIPFGVMPLGPEWQSYEITGSAESDDLAAELVLGLGKNKTTIWLDEIMLQAGSREIWRRDFENGLVLVNATSSPQTIPLEGTFRKIAGKQDRYVNDGRSVEQITLPAFDGIILLR